MTRRPSLPLPERRGLSREQAAGYVGVSPGLFDEMVKDGRMPGAKLVNSRLVWDRHKIDEYFEAIPDHSVVDFNPWDEPDSSEDSGTKASAHRDQPENKISGRGR